MNFISRLLQRIIVVVVALSVIWFIVTQVFNRLDQRVPFFIALMITYFVSAYIILPRVISITLLVLRKGRIPRFTRASDGLTIDPVNIILLGNKNELESVFKKMGWHGADQLTIKSSLKMIGAYILKKPYNRAPFSSLFLFGRKQDIEFQKAIENNPRKRHHVRFWATNTNKIVDPLDINYWTKKQKNDHNKAFTWIGAGSKDIGLGFTKLSYRISHKVDTSNVDEERKYILNSLKKSHCIGKISYYKPGAFKVGKYTSDGRIAVAKLR
jgi:LssY C-terminus